VFLNETVQSYCKEAGIEFTRCRPYRKNDQAWVEQKNGAVVRHIVGYRGYQGLRLRRLWVGSMDRFVCS
jgi:transposase